MAFGWFSLLQLVPWGDVISNAPKVVDGAKKLWNAVSRKPPAGELPVVVAQPALATGEPTFAILQAQLAAAEAAVSDLHHQMLASSELIKALADQNAQLIKRMETTRIRVLRLSWATVILSVVAVINLVMVLAHS